MKSHMLEVRVMITIARYKWIVTEWGTGRSWVLAIFYLMSRALRLVHAPVSSNRPPKGRSACNLSLSLCTALHYIYSGSSA